MVYPVPAKKINFIFLTGACIMVLPFTEINRKKNNEKGNCYILSFAIWAEAQSWIKQKKSHFFIALELVRQWDFISFQ